MFEATVAYHDDTLDTDLYADHYQHEDAKTLDEMVNTRIRHLGLQARLDHMPNSASSDHNFSVRRDGKVVATFPCGSEAEAQLEQRKREIRDEGLEPLVIWDCRLGGEVRAAPDGTPVSTESARAENSPWHHQGRRLKLLWACQLKGDGFAYGYATHANRLREALLAAGVSIVYNQNEDCDFALHFMPPDMFKPVQGKKNLLFTTAEMSEPTAPLAAKPDLLVVPCAFNKEVFAKGFSGDIEICPEGVNIDRFQFHPRETPGPDEPFRFLFNGNTRDSTKGVDLLKAAWRAWRESGRMPANAQLYIKTTGTSAVPLQYRCVAKDGELIGPFAASPSEPHAGLPRAEILDNRNLPLPEFIALYNSAHALLSPSLGEGWNLILCEAMATGMPCIWSHHSAMLDYADESIGYPLRDLSPVPMWEYGQPVGVGDPSYYASGASDDGIIAAMKEVYADYPAALERGRRASERMHSQYTWRQAAEKFITICEKYA